jgi:glutamate formiminotransferase
MALLECVPNFSEGRDAAVQAALRSALLSVPGVRLLDWHADPDHNRSVATCVGASEPLRAALLAALAEAARRIDLRRHRGVHPRLGATDVVPFVPLQPADMPECVAAARGLAQRVGQELAIPVFLYGEAALHPERRSLPAVRRGGFEGLRESIERDPGRVPDAGPRRLHPSAGAVAIGARTALIAFNVNLDSDDLALARSIARAIRESSGGLPGIRALGLALASRGIVQVSVNVCDPERTGLEQVFRACERLARERGVTVRESELVGLCPRSALDAQVARAVRLASFDPRRQVLEEALAAC